jgi:low temperature requirement protein LtrA
MYVRRFLLSAVVFAGIMTVSLSSAFAQGSPLFAVLNGGNQVNAAGVARAGDLDGFGSATVNFSNITTTSVTLCYAILVSNITAATAAHIHRGRSGVNGAIVVPFLAPVGSPGRIAGCTSITPTLYSAIRAFPSEFYVNVHNRVFPNGAVRGQLF